MWIDGVGFVATMVMLAIRAARSSDDRLSVFHKFERRFVWQAGF